MHAEKILVTRRRRTVEGAVMSLSDVLSDKRVESVAKSAPTADNSQKVESKPEPQQAKSEPVASNDAQRQSGPQVQAVENSTPQKEAQSQTQQDSRTVPYQALRDERRKRQDLERELSYMKGQLEAVTKKTAAPDVPQPKPEESFFADPVAFVDQRLQQQRIAISEAIVREQHPDYDEAINNLAETAKHSPWIYQELARQQNPAAWAYRYGKQLMELRNGGISSIDDLRRKTEAELRPKIEAELRQQLALQAAQNAPKTLADARSVGQTSGAPQGPDRSLGDILRA